jgi:hypothetical protein
LLCSAQREAGHVRSRLVDGEVHDKEAALCAVKPPGIGVPSASVVVTSLFTTALIVMLNANGVFG